MLGESLWRHRIRECGPRPGTGWRGRFFPEEFADLLAKQLGSPKAIDRMTDWLYHVRPRSVEMVVDEMLAICSDIEAWKKKKESQEAQWGYTRWLNSETRWKNEEEE